jgi:hypothetical protein
MNKLIFLIVIALAFCSCKKTQSTPNNLLSVSGSYKLYSIIDTLYTTMEGGPTYMQITHLNQAGDTVYTSVGTPLASIIPNYIVFYDPAKYLSDTLAFSSTTTGVRKTSINSRQFTYSAATGSYKDISGYSVTNYILIGLTSTTIELLGSTSNTSSTQPEKMGLYYKKIN